MTDHLGELAALYALGALDERELRLADEHLERCDACRRLLAQAEADVTAMEAARVQFDPPARMVAPSPPQPSRRTPSAWLAAVAAVVIALLPSAYLIHENAEMHAAIDAQAGAFADIATSAHRVASFSGTDARVMYANDGSWYYIVIRGARSGLNVVWPHDGIKTMLGSPTLHGDVASLYLPKSHRMDRLTLERDGRVVGQAQLVF